MERFAELTVKQANEETRPYKVIGMFPGTEDVPAAIMVEYLDVYEYKSTWETHSLSCDGWGVIEAHGDHEGNTYYVQRRAKPATESGAADD